MGSSQKSAASRSGVPGIVASRAFWAVMTRSTRKKSAVIDTVQGPVLRSIAAAPSLVKDDPEQLIGP